jgi:hypothetical protein
MKTVTIGMDEMLRRVARFKALRPSRKAFVDSLIPGHEREIFNVIGRGVTEDTTLSPAITDARDFNLTLVSAEPGYLMAILGGTDAGHVSWSPDVLEQAKSTGLALDAEGNLLAGSGR